MCCNTLEVTESYRYLSVIFDKFLTFEKYAKTLSDSAGRALSAVISKFKRLRNIGFNTSTNLYYAGVTLFCVGFHQIINLDMPIQNRAIKYFLGVHKNAPNLAVKCTSSLGVTYMLCILSSQIY